MDRVGSIFTESQTKDNLMNLNRDYNNQQTWKNMLGNVNLNSALSQQSLTKGYDTAINEAYNSYMQNQNSVANSGIVGSGRNQLMNSSTADMQEAYDSYLQNLAKGQTSIEDSRLAAQQEIDDALTKQAQYTNDYADSFYGYLTDLAYKYNKGYEEAASEDYKGLFDDVRWSKFALQDDQGNLVRDEDGLIQLRDYNDIYSEFYDVLDSGATVLNPTGEDFFDLLINSNIGDYSFEQYLKENNSDLYNWAIGFNEYSSEGSNADTMKNLLGMDTDDYTYSFMERAGGLNEGDLKKLFTKYNSVIEDLAGYDYDDNSEETKNAIANKLTEANEGIFDLVSQLGMTDQLQEAGITKESLKILGDKLKDITALGDKALTSAELDAALAEAGIKLTDEERNSTLASLGAGAAAGGIAAAAGGPVALVIGLAIFGAGAIANIVSGVVNDSKKSKAAELQRQKAIQNYEKAYNTAVNQLMNSALESKRQAEIDAGMLPSTPQKYNQNLTSIKAKKWNTLPNKSKIGQITAIDPKKHIKGGTITDNHGNRWQIQEIISNDYAKQQGYKNGDAMLTEIIGSDDFETTDGYVVKGSTEDVYYIPMAGFGTWMVVKPSAD